MREEQEARVARWQMTETEEREDVFYLSDENDVEIEDENYAMAEEVSLFSCLCLGCLFFSC
jgi:hypothetical protein